MVAEGYDNADREQASVVGHRAGPLLVSGRAGSGRSEALVRRFVSLVEDGVRAERILLTCRTRAGAAHLRDKVEGALAHPHEELWIGTQAEIAERILREHPTEAGLDPFFTTVTAADRLAIMLDRVDDLPLRRHEIRGNPAGLLARLLRRIDLLKLECVTPDRLRDWAMARDREATRPAERERSRREAEFAELYARHDRMIAEAGSLDEGDLVVAGARLMADRVDTSEELTSRFEHVMVDELEDAAPAHMRFMAELARRARRHRRCVRPASVHQALSRRGPRSRTTGSMKRGPTQARSSSTGQHRAGEMVATAVAAMLGEAVEPPAEPDARCGSGVARASRLRPRRPRGRSRRSSPRERRCPSRSA